MAKKKLDIPKGESKADCFRRVISPRVRKALKAIRLVGSVTGSSYESDDAQIARINGTLAEAVVKAMESLKGSGDSRDGFSL